MVKKGAKREVIIVPTAAEGASVFTRKHPKIISFFVPEKQVGSDLKGRTGENAQAGDTYLAVLTAALNGHLAQVNKCVVDLVDMGRDFNMVGRVRLNQYLYQIPAYFLAISRQSFRRERAGGGSPLSQFRNYTS